MKGKTQIEPLDAERCQAEKPNGNSFMTFGGVPGLERCRSKPAFVVVEKKAGADGLQGAMTMCAECFMVFKKQVGTKNALVFNLKERA